MYRLVALGLGYLLGGIQSAILYGRFKGIEIRNHGSGNAGPTIPEYISPFVLSEISL